ncbi:MAG: tetratricopeptide repeat protein [Arenicellales bacterium]
MADLHLSEDEQAERLKTWWKENGSSVIAGAVLGIVVIGGVNYWRSHKAHQEEAASALYAQLVQGTGEKTAADLGRQLMDDYSSTPYAGKAALVLAKSAFESGDKEKAKSRLEWAMNNAPDPEDRKVARLRLARVELDLGEVEKARTLLAGMKSGGYESQYRELLGDIAMASKDPAKARKEYQAALESLPERSSYAGMLNLKLDAAIGASK